jgi:hypothetical protein
MAAKGILFRDRGISNLIRPASKIIRAAKLIGEMALSIKLEKDLRIWFVFCSCHLVLFRGFSLKTMGNQQT